MVGVCSTRNVDLVRRLGATDVVDYTKSAPYAGQAPFDAIYDCVGSKVADFLPLLASGGRFASCLPGPSLFANAALNLVRGKKVIPVLLRANAADLGVLDALKLKVEIDSRFPLTELGAAWERSRSGRVVGKVVIDV